MTFPQYFVTAIIFGLTALVMGVDKGYLYLALCIALLEVFKPIFIAERVKTYGKKGLFNDREIRDHNE